MAALPDLLLRRVQQHPDHIALRGPDAILSYQDLWRAAGAVADQLRNLGVKRIGLCGDNTPAWVVADLACLMAEVVCVPVPVFFSKSQTEHLIQRAGLDALLFSAEADQAEAIGQGVWLRHLPVSAGAAWMPEHTAKITFTSGSTGTPKGVCLSAQQMAATACALQQRLEGVTLQQHLCILPLATLLENIAGVYLPLLMGATVTVAPLQTLGMTGSSGLELGQLVVGLNQHQPHSVILVPELAMALANAAGNENGGHSRVTAIFGLVGAVNIPIIHYSVLWWNSLHQPPSISMGQSSMAPEFLVPLLVATIGFSLIFGGVVLARMRTLLADQQAEARLRRKAMRESGAEARA